MYSISNPKQIVATLAGAVGCGVSAFASPERNHIEVFVGGDTIKSGRPILRYSKIPRLQ
jgi:hypothetical protein